MKNLSKVALGALILAMLVGCGEDAKFGDKLYQVDDFLKDEKLLVELVEFCEKGGKPNLSDIQIKNCETAQFQKSKYTQKWGDGPSRWEKLVEKYGSKDKK